MSLHAKILEAAAKIRRDLPSGLDESLAEFAVKYLNHYGHIPDGLLQDREWQAIYAKALAGVHWIAQCFHDSPNVLEVLRRLPEVQRCGCPDFDENGMEKAQAKWNKRLLIVRIASYCPGVPDGEQIENMRKNLANTTAVCGIAFNLLPDSDKTTKADLTLYAKKIDGVGRVLGQQYLPDGRDSPQYGELDIADMDSVSIHRRTSLHETCGHGVGCVHINSPGSVMNPYLTSHTTWQQADIDQLQRLYGPPATSPQPPAQPEGKTLDLRKTTADTVIISDDWVLQRRKNELQSLYEKFGAGHLETEKQS